MQISARRSKPDDRDTAPEAPDPAPFFVSEAKIHPKSVHGRFRRIKWRLSLILLALYAVLPWLRWDRGAGAPDQALLFDLDAQRFYLFGIELWPQHIYYLTGAMILAAVGLFLTTALAGRVWCGYACPQTVWTDLFVLVERWVEGDRGARIRLDNGPRNAVWLLKKSVKMALWLVIAALTGVTAILYFVDAPGFFQDLSRLEASPTVLGWMLFMTGSTFAMAGFMREQMCRYACPWPRFQSAMLDDDSLVVTYQPWRGEGRAPLRKDQSWEARQQSGRGDCIDCGACVHVCPVGIDIRAGLQMDCIACGLCADACDDVMTRIGRPAGLIRYDTQAAQTAKAQQRVPPPYRLIRPRTLVYVLLMVVVGGAMAIGLILRPSAELTVLRDRAPLFIRLSDGAIQNSYTVKIVNQSRGERQFRLSATGLERLALSGPGTEALPDGTLGLSAAPDAVQTYRIHVRTGSGMAGTTISGSAPLTFTLSDLSGSTARTVRTVFLAP